MNETDLQNRIRVALSETGIVIRMNSGVFKTADGRAVKQGIPGMPDLLWLGPDGKTAWIEVKTAKGRVAENQQRFIDRLQHMGHRAGIARSVKEAMEIVGGTP
jgi:hypothetical protein